MNAIHSFPLGTALQYGHDCVTSRGTAPQPALKWDVAEAVAMLIGVAAGVWDVLGGTAQPYVPPSPSPEAVAAARALGVAVDASTDEIRAAFRRAVFRAHPDRAGDAGTARTVWLIQARDTLLRAREQ